MRSKNHEGERRHNGYYKQELEHEYVSAEN